MLMHTKILAKEHLGHVQVTSGTLLGVEAPTETESSKSSCFPGSALVQTRSGAKLMRHVRLGDEVNYFFA